MAVAATLAGFAAPAGAYQRPGERLSVDLTSAGQLPTSGTVGSTSISRDGRYIAFDTDAAGLVAGDDNNASDVFLRDTRTGRTILASHALSGGSGTGVSVCVTVQSCWGSAGRVLPTGLPNPNYGAWDASVSGDGRYVAFTSVDYDLVAGDTNATLDVFVYDAKTRAIRRVSVDSAGKQANGPSYLPSVSASGRYVSFTSEATNLVAGDTNAYPDAFVHDMRTGATTRVSVSSTGGEACAHIGCTPSTAPWLIPVESDVSSDGRYVVFTDEACNLVANNPNCGTMPDVYLRDRVKGTTQLISVNINGAPATYPEATNRVNSGSILSGPNTVEDYATSRTISDNGNFVVFASGASDLVPNDPSWTPATVGSGIGVFVRDVGKQRTYRVDVTSNGEPPMSHFSNGTTSSMPMMPSISGNGQVVTMYCEQCISTQPLASLQVYDRRDGQAMPVPMFPDASYNRASAQVWNGDWNPEISGDGRYLSYLKYWTPKSPPLLGWSGAADAFRYDYGAALGAGGLAGRRQASPTGATGVVARSDASSDVNRTLTAQGANLTGASVISRPEHGDLFVRLEVAHMPEFALVNPELVYAFGLTVGGTRYELRAGKVGPNPSFGLFRLVAGAWTHVTEAAGGYGTTGAEIVVALPLADIGAQHGTRLRDVQALTGFGTTQTGIVDVVDRLALG